MRLMAFPVIIIAMVLVFGILIFGMLNPTAGSPYDKILDAGEIAGDWTVTEESERLNTWDRQGGSQMVTRTYTLSNSTLMIEITEYYEERAERSFPTQEPPDGVASKPVNLGDEGLFWISDGRMYIHYRLGGNIVFSWLDDGGNPDLDEGWFLELMGLQEIKISGR